MNSILTHNSYAVPLKRTIAKEVTAASGKMSRKKAYWISQVSGWLLFILFNVFIYATFNEFSWRRLFLLLYLWYAGISFTHIFRSIIKKYEWLSLPLKKIIPRVLISCIIVGAVIFAFYITAGIISNVFTFERFKVGSIIVGIFNMSIVTLLWTLTYFAVHYFENYRRAQIESLIWEAAVKDFELRTLKSQLNPHFMFNALNSIRALIKEDPGNAQTAVTKLSNILRYSLKMEKIETVKLEEEMQTVSDYLALETIRFEERLRFNINIDPKTAKIEIPPMMIQTLVENGIKHGLSKQTGGGEIFINSCIDNSSLHIKIKNTGNINEEELHNSQGFGINNTKHRLHLLYGEKASFTIQNCSENEVLAEVIIPIGG
jgi:two-component system, LytTR family, sensor kinase